MFSTIVDCATLAAHLGDPNWVIVDCRHDLADPQKGRAAYDLSHIAGAYHLHLDEDLASERGENTGRHPLPRSGVLGMRLGQLGITRGVQIVAYDDAGGMFASRLWWLAKWLNHPQVAVLNGGWQAWQAAGLPTETEEPWPQSQFCWDTPNEAMTVDAAYVEAHLHDNEMFLVDARSPERYAGIGETLDPVGGHIPGARNRFFQHNLVSPNGFFKSPDQLKTEWLALLNGQPVEQVVAQCGSGVTACHNLLALEIAGLSGARLYPGSWSEWCSDRRRPIETGNS